MKTFSNTTPFIALASIDRLHVLPELLGVIYAAQSVLAECAEGGRILVPDLSTLDWVCVVADEHEAFLPALFELDRGEKQTILLARAHAPARVLMDERLGRRMAEYLGLQVTGTLGVLAKAKQVGLIPSFYQAAHAMREQGIHFHPGLIDRLSQHLGEDTTS